MFWTQARPQTTLLLFFSSVHCWPPSWSLDRQRHRPWAGCPEAVSSTCGQWLPARLHASPLGHQRGRDVRLGGFLVFTSPGRRQCLGVNRPHQGRVGGWGWEWSWVTHTTYTTLISPPLPSTEGVSTPRAPPSTMSSVPGWPQRVLLPEPSPVL